MKVSVFGLGYVGTVGAACLARDGNRVVSVDVSHDKVAMVARGLAPVVEPGLHELLQQAVNAGRLVATTSAFDAVMESELSFVAVGTPSRSDGSLDTSIVFKVCDQIGAAAAVKAKPHVVVVRSTVSPGTTEQCAEILRNGSGGGLIAVAFNPEFLREGTAIEDYTSPAYTIIGTHDAHAEHTLRRIYATLSAPIIVTQPAVAEAIKLVSNAWHATKVAFANEIGRLARALQFDGREVMEIVAKDTKLNTSPAYMRPGFAFGGSCLPKDLRALTYFARTRNIELPLLSSLMASNQAQLDAALKDILATEKSRIGLVGLAFKAGTDDLRESPALELAERLIGKGRELRILDPAVCETKLIGANRRFLESKLPHLSRLLVSSVAELLDHSELVVMTQHNQAVEERITRSDIRIKHVCCAGSDQGEALQPQTGEPVAESDSAPEPCPPGTLFEIA